MACNLCKLARIKREMQKRRELERLKKEAENKKRLQEQREQTAETYEKIPSEHEYVLTDEEEKIMGPDAISLDKIVTVEAETAPVVETEAEVPKKKRRKPKTELAEAESVEEKLVENIDTAIKQEVETVFEQAREESCDETPKTSIIDEEEENG